MQKTQRSTPVSLFLITSQMIFLMGCQSFHMPIYTASRAKTEAAAVFYGLGGDEEFMDSTDSGSITVPSSLRSQDWIAPLARLASARSSGLKVENIHQVSVGRVDEEQLDIEAIVCERDDCVSLSVPVELPRPCTDRWDEEIFERCIVENLEQLDQAHQASLATKVFATEEEFELANRVNDELTSMDNIEYPIWWVETSGVDEVIQDCLSLRTILNEAEFHNDLMSLVSTRCVFQESDISPGQVYVIEIGLSGMIVRATANQAGKLLGITEIPIPFPSPAADAATLRELVLNTVEQVSP